LSMTEQAAPLYKVLRNHKLPITGRYFDVTTVEASGLRWEDAKALSDRLQREEAEAKPLQTCWTYDIFFSEREDIEKSRVGKRLRATKRKRRKTAAVPTKQPSRAVQLAIQW
jgi:hypothetical protein